jgi:hypothetical protein
MPILEGRAERKPEQKRRAERQDDSVARRCMGRGAERAGSSVNGKTNQL